MRTTSTASVGEVAAALDRLERLAEHGTLDTGRYRCRYHAWGQGPPLVFVPGLGDEALSFALLSDRLADRFRCITYDLPGRPGDGSVGPPVYPGLVADLLALLDHLGEAEAAVCGFSFGSTIALSALPQAPDRLTRAVLIAGFAHRPLTLPEWALARFALHWSGTMDELPGYRTMQHRLMQPAFSDRPTDRWEFYLARSGAAPMRTVAANALLLHGSDLRPRLAEVRSPVLLITSPNDPLVPAASTAALLRGLPQALRFDLPRGGHFMIYSHPDELAEAIAGFLHSAGAVHVAQPLRDR
jgi:pimeloyl-ACP methyl ester carboxylesterase